MFWRISWSFFFSLCPTREPARRLFLFVTADIIKPNQHCACVTSASSKQRISAWRQLNNSFPNRPALQDAEGTSFKNDVHVLEAKVKAIWIVSLLPSQQHLKKIFESWQDLEYFQKIMLLRVLSVGEKGLKNMIGIMEKTYGWLRV